MRSNNTWSTKMFANKQKKRVKKFFLLFSTYTYSACIFFILSKELITRMLILLSIISAAQAPYLIFFLNHIFFLPIYFSATSERPFGIVSLGHLGSRLLRSYVSPRPPDPMPSGYLPPVAFMYARARVKQTVRPAPK